MGEYLEIRTTAGSRDEAERLATALVEARLAACVQIVGPARSIYRWEGQVESADEYLLLVKTVAAAYDQVEQEIQRSHSYQVPEILAVRIQGGLASYCRWISEQVGGPDRS